jgi:NAD dependent epimerase/dehydratase family enzyme
MPIPTDTKLYEHIKEQVYKDIPKHSLFRSAQVVKRYKEAGGTYTGGKTKDGIQNWFKSNWISINDLYHDNKIVPCGSSESQKKYGEYPLCRPEEIAKKLSKDAMRKMIERKDKLKHKTLITESVLGTDKYNVSNKYT